MRASLSLLALAVVAGLASAQPIVINEVSVWNDRGLADADGNRGDWVELHNASDETVDLTGFGLSDDAAQPKKWVVTSRTLLPRAYAVVFCSGKNRQSAKELHANFKLKAGGGVILLTHPDGKRMDEVTLKPVNVPDVSQGRADSAGWQFFSRPSAGSGNAAESFSGIVAPPKLSVPSGFYSNEFTLAVSGEAGGETRFTLDGSEPTPESPLFTEPLTIKDRSPEPNGISEIKGTSTANQHTNGWFPPSGLVAKGTVVRARTFHSGAIPSAVSTGTYFVGINQQERYKLPVIALSTAPAGLFDYNKGIYVLGKIFDDYRKANPRETLTGHTPANYTQRGANWARAAYFEMFESDGKRVAATNVTIDIQGQSSRSFRQKSLGVNPKGDLSPSSTIDYPVFPGLKKRGNGEPVTKLKGLRMRNSGNDWDYTMFRDALCHRLAEPLGIDTQATRHAVVFLNGEFWGIYDVREQLEREYLSVHYDTPVEQIVICETDGVLKEGKAGDEAHFRTMRSFLNGNDPALAENFDKVRTMMDVDSFLRYHLAEIYMGNADWPHNNIRFWRLKTPYDAAAPVGRDGRWRWIMFDLDLGYAHPWSQGLTENALASVTNINGRNGDAPWSSLLMRRMLLNPGFKEQFIETMADYLNSTFSAARATAMVDEMQAMLEPAMAEHIRRWRTSGNSLATWRSNVRVMRSFASGRPRTAFQQYSSKFALGGTAVLTVQASPPAGGRVQVNSLTLDPRTHGVSEQVYPWQGTYFKARPVRLRALPMPGYAFAGWQGLGEESGQDPSQIAQQITLADNVTVTALFKPIQPTHDLAKGSFAMTEWKDAAPAGMRIDQTSTTDPKLNTPLESSWTQPFNLNNRSRVIAYGANGLAFLNTGNAQETSGSGHLGALVLALNTAGAKQVAVSWKGRTITPGPRVQAIRLQYSVGGAGFRDVLDSRGVAVEYVANTLAGHEQTLGPVTLPAEVAGQPFVELRWKYYHVSGEDGARSQLAVDDVLVSADAVAQAGRIVSVSRDASGRLAVRYAGEASREHRLEVSPDLLRWEPAQTFRTDTAGQAEVTMPVENSGRKFVRVAVSG